MVGTAIEPEDVARLSQLNQDIELEQERVRQLETAWGKDRSVPPAPARSFAGRYGALSESGKPSVDAKYDKVEYAIRNFPFDPGRSRRLEAQPVRRRTRPRRRRWAGAARGNWRRSTTRGRCS